MSLWLPSRRRKKKHFRLRISFRTIRLSMYMYPYCIVWEKKTSLRVASSRLFLSLHRRQWWRRWRRQQSIYVGEVLIGFSHVIIRFDLKVFDWQHTTSHTNKSLTQRVCVLRAEQMSKNRLTYIWFWLVIII